jgi:F-type H+-transporting ATPase subunit epsilon
MIVEILSPEGKIYAGEVVGVQLPGTSGLFEVLDKHAPMVSALRPGNVKVLVTKTETENFTIKGGFAEVFNNKTTILVEGILEV